MHAKPFKVERWGVPIEFYPLKNPGKASGITYSSSFGEWEAAHGARLDLWKWENNEYPNWFKARVVAWWNDHQLVESHRQDANYVKPKKG